MVRKASAPRDLPEFLRPLFWEYQFGRLRWETDRELVVGRVLSRGDWHAVRWLMERAGRDGLREWIVRRKGRGLDARRLRFWELVLDLPKREVDTWVQEMGKDSWPRRVAR